MAIAFECEDCGKSYTVSEAMAGRTGACKQCGHPMTVPGLLGEDDYDLDAPGPDRAGAAPLPPRASAPTSPRRIPSSGPAGSAPKKSFFAFGKNEIGGLAAAVLLIVWLLWFRPMMRQQRARAWNEAAAPAPVPVPHFIPPPTLVVAPPAPPPASRTGPIALPNFPDPGPAREIEPGIAFREVDLGPPRPGAPPGWSGKIWIYTPSGDHAPRSLPCILIAGAGSNLITGMTLGDGDRAEHLPYVRAGLAVIAFELDGMVEDMQKATGAQMLQGIGQFLAARAGLVNAHIALEYALARVPEVDPARLTAAGHSSAATLALLFAENEPRLRSCLAYAPVVDIESIFNEHYGPQMAAQLKRGGSGDFFTTYSPRTDEAKLDRPLFLFYAQDDQNARDLDAFAGRMKAAGKPVTVSTVSVGGHHEPMIRQGIPGAIAWLQGRPAPEAVPAAPAAGARRGIPTPRKARPGRPMPGGPGPR